MIVIMI